jgi:hypothetical protein
VRAVTTTDDRLYFFSGSADLPPGQGVNERVADPADYAALAGVRHWRRMLSNFWPAEFRLGEHGQVRPARAAARGPAGDPAGAAVARHRARPAAGAHPRSGDDPRRLAPMTSSG